MNLIVYLIHFLSTDCGAYETTAGGVEGALKMMNFAFKHYEFCIKDGKSCI